VPRRRSRCPLPPRPEVRLRCLKPRQGPDRSASAYCPVPPLLPAGWLEELAAPPGAGHGHAVVERHRAFHHSTAPRHELRAPGGLEPRMFSAAASPRATQPRPSASARATNPPAGLVGHESHSPSLEAATNPCTRIGHPLPTIRPPPGSRETGLNMENRSLRHTVVSKAASQYTASAALPARIGRDTPPGRQPRVRGGVDIVDLQRVCEWTWARFGGIEAARSAGSGRHLPALGPSLPRPAVGAIEAVEADRCRGGEFGNGGSPRWCGYVPRVRVLVRLALALRRNVARPVPEGDRAGCAYSLPVTVSFAGRACHPLTTCSGRDG
jgi:hypothetical protein